MNDIFNISTAKLKQIVALKRQIEKLSVRLQSLASISAASPKKSGRKRRKMSAAGRAKIAAAARARWANVRAARKKKGTNSTGPRFR
jgi:hypothetical protein